MIRMGKAIYEYHIGLSICGMLTNGAAHALVCVHAFGSDTAAGQW